jgi:hypothetical protein
LLVNRITHFPPKSKPCGAAKHPFGRSTPEFSTKI